MLSAVKSDYFWFVLATFPTRLLACLSSCLSGATYFAAAFCHVFEFVFQVFTVSNYKQNKKGYIVLLMERRETKLYTPGQFARSETSLTLPSLTQNPKTKAT